jgi:arylsulfatase A-like enzyme
MNLKGFLGMAAVCAAAISVTAATPVSKAEPPKRPNILVIVADDLGYTDVGAYGSEIRTPNIDALAASSMMLTNYHTPPLCSLTRSQLLTGVDHHLTGLGNLPELSQPNQKGKPGYEGGLNKSVVTVAEILRPQGYETLMVGKWHLGFAPDQGPAARGFDHSYALLNGASNHFGQDADSGTKFPAHYVEDGKTTTPPAKGFYSSDFFTDRMISLIDGAAGDGKPFFGYLAFTAVHYPLMAPPEEIAKYKGMYDAGYEALREQRIRRMKALGLLPADAKVEPNDAYIRRWKDLTPAERAYESRKMEIYAAMATRMDANIGRLLAHLKATGQYDNTLIVFVSDNGSEGNELDKGQYGAYARATLAKVDNSYANIGKASSYVWLGPGWAQAGSGGLRLFKAFPTEGGTRVVGLLSDPRSKRSGRRNEYVSSLDIPATIIRAAGVQNSPTEWDGRLVHAFAGKNLLPALAEDKAVHTSADVEGWEALGRRAVRQGRWKAVLIPHDNGQRPGTGQWQLFDLTTDPGETHDLAKAHPDVLKTMTQNWDAYAQRVGLILPQTPNF